MTTVMARSGDPWYGGKREAGLLRFALAITILNILGHTLLGFEQAWAHPVVALLAAYGTELVLEAADAWAQGRRAAFRGSAGAVFRFLLSAHITGLAVSMLLYANQRYWVVTFAAATAIASKRLFRVRVAQPGTPPGRHPTRHVFNPSNFGIVVTLLLFPSVGIAPPYQFTENVRGPLDLILPAIIVASGTLINLKFTGRMPLILSWLAAFAIQALVRSGVYHLPWLADLTPMTGLAFVLFTFYMVTDPGTTPSRPRAQVIFGTSTALVYGLLVVEHVAFGLFFALAVVCAARGLAMYRAGHQWEDQAAPVGHAATRMQ